MADPERKARVSAQFDQAGAAGEDLAQDSEVERVVWEWRQASIALARVLLQNGVAREGLMGAMLSPTADLVVEVRSEGQ